MSVPSSLSANKDVRESDLRSVSMASLRHQVQFFNDIYHLLPLGTGIDFDAMEADIDGFVDVGAAQTVSQEVLHNVTDEDAAFL